jgi:hypothetical protein
MPAAGVLDSLTRVGKRPKVNVSHVFAVGMSVSVYRPHPQPKGWEKLATLIIKEIPKDGRGHETNEMFFTEPLPKSVRVGDLLIYEVNSDASTD